MNMKKLKIGDKIETFGQLKLVTIIPAIDMTQEKTIETQFGTRFTFEEVELFEEKQEQTEDCDELEKENVTTKFIDNRRKIYNTRTFKSEKTY